MTKEKDITHTDTIPCDPESQDALKADVVNQIRDLALNIYTQAKPDELPPQSFIDAKNDIGQAWCNKPNRSFGENEGLNYLHSSHSVFGQKIPLRRSKKHFLSARLNKKLNIHKLLDHNFSRGLCPLAYISSPFVAPWALKLMCGLPELFKNAMSPFACREYFVIGVDLSVLSQNDPKPFAGPMLALTGFKGKNFKKAYSNLIDKIEAIRF